MASIVPTHEEHAEHWGFIRDWRDTLEWIDTTTFRAVDKSVLNTTAQSALRRQLGRVEMSETAGVRRPCPADPDARHGRHPLD